MTCSMAVVPFISSRAFLGRRVELVLTVMKIAFFESLIGFDSEQPLFLFENPTADIGDVQSRRVVLKRHQSPQFVHIEVRVSLLTERNADEGSRRKSSDQDIAVSDHFFRAPSREHHGSRRVLPDFPGGALDIFDRVKLEDKLPAPGDLHSLWYEGLAVLAPE